MEAARHALKMLGLALAVLSLCAAQSALAQAAPAPRGGAATAGEVTQKQALVRNLLSDASAAKRIRESQDPEAQRFYAVAEEHYAAALAALKQRDFARAEQQLDQTITALGKARRRVPDASRLAIAQRVRYRQLLEGVESLALAYSGHLQRAGVSSGSAPDGAAELARITAMLEQAQAHADAARPGDALRLLEQAEQAVMSAMSRTLGEATLDYTPTFATPAEEYTFELERNRGYLELIPLAIAQLKPARAEQLIMERHLEQNRAQLEQAREHARRQDYRLALESLRAGSGHLHSALIAAGLDLPEA